MRIQASKRKSKNRWAYLGDFVALLNRRPERLDPGVVEAVTGILLGLEKVPIPAIEGFQKLAEDLQLGPIMTPVLDARGRLERAELHYMMDESADGGLVGALGKALQDGGWRRLGQCRVCVKWILQLTKPPQYCSETCRWRAWEAQGGNRGTLAQQRAARKATLARRRRKRA